MVAEERLTASWDTIPVESLNETSQLKAKRARIVYSTYTSGEGVLQCSQCGHRLDSCDCRCGKPDCDVPGCGFVPLSLTPVPLSSILETKDMERVEFFASQDFVLRNRLLTVDGNILIDGHHRVAAKADTPTWFLLVEEPGSAVNQLAWNTRLIQYRPRCT